LSSDLNLSFFKQNLTLVLEFRRRKILEGLDFERHISVNIIFLVNELSRNQEPYGLDHSCCSIMLICHKIYLSTNVLTQTASIIYLRLV